MKIEQVEVEIVQINDDNVVVQLRVKPVGEPWVVLPTVLKKGEKIAALPLTKIEFKKEAGRYSA